MWQLEHGWDKNGKVADIDATFDPDALTLTLKYPQGISSVPVFNHLSADNFGKTTDASRLPGPFAEANYENHNVDPRNANVQK